MKDTIYYLGADGPALPADAKDVKRFFDSFYIVANK
jgi:hypothetical protein